MNADHAKAAEFAADGLDNPHRNPGLVNLCQAYLERTAEVTALKEKLRSILGRVDEVILDLDDEARGV